MLVSALAEIEPFLRKHPAARDPIRRWAAIVDGAAWHSIVDARATLRSADAIQGTNLTCFNIGGNRFRLMAVVSYERQEVVVYELLTHTQYTRKYVK